MTRYIEYLVQHPGWVKETIRMDTKMHCAEDAYQDIVLEAIERKLDGPVPEILARQIHTWKVRHTRQNHPCVPYHAGMDSVRIHSKTDTLDAESILSTLTKERDREIMLMAMGGSSLREIARQARISHQRVAVIIKQTIAKLKEKYVGSGKTD